MRVRMAVALVACVLGAASVFASPAGAGHAPAGQVPHGFGTAAEVPWGSVGGGWLLVGWQAGTPAPHHAVPSYLVLISPTGQRYLLMREDRALAAATLAAWSGDGSRALFASQTASRTTMQVIDLHTGTLSSSFVVPTSRAVNYQSASFTRPDGLATDVLTFVQSGGTSANGHDELTRYSLQGQPETTYPHAFPAVGRFVGSWLASPDGTSLVLGAGKGLAVVSNAGAILRQVVIHGASSCSPVRWWSRTTVLAQCGPGPLYVFPVDGGAPAALTRKPVPPDSGDISAWHVGRSVYVQVASACGYVYLARLVGADPVMVHVPGVPTGHTVFVVGVSQRSIAVEASLACQGHPSLMWYTPSTRSVKVVFGPPINGGVIGTVLIYPPPLG